MTESVTTYRFVVDAMLGKMAKWLRIMGYDTIFTFLKSQEEVKSYVQSGRTVVTRARRWCHIDGVICIKSNYVREQLAELFSAMKLECDPESFLARCAYCNRELEECSREEAYGKVPEYVWHNTDDFFKCSECGKIYWSGSHVSRMLDHLRDWLGISKIVKAKEKGGTHHE
ncbi:MAG: Mut7-C RNAse domain-containing protein [Thermodesulforhabdaceae bacterium]|jgi:uncharacterized protein with PIN domain